MRTTPVSTSNPFAGSAVYLHTADYSRSRSFEPEIDELELEPDELRYLDESQADSRLSDLHFLREYILNTAAYIESLESELGDTSEEFWQEREQAYRIVTDLLIDIYLAGYED